MRKLSFAVVGLFFLSLGVWALPPFPPPNIVATVIGVVDGDTIDVRLVTVPDSLSSALPVGSVQRVRYIGVQAPEPGQPDGPAATELNRLLVMGRTVYLELDDKHREDDEDRRLLAYVYLDRDGNFMVNLALIATPIIETKAYPGTTRYADLFAQIDRLRPSSPPCLSTGPLTLEFIFVSSPVKAGAFATVTVKTAPGAYCKITVKYPTGDSTATGLGPKTADANGRVTWSWKVGTQTAAGTHTIVVTAELCGESVKKDTTFTTH